MEITSVSRRCWLLSAVLAVSCRRNTTAAPAFPTHVAEWTLESGPHSAEPIRAAIAGWSVSYGGQPKMNVTVYRMPAQASAFDAMQRWRPEKGKIPFFRGPFFGVVGSADADFATLSRFVTALQTTLPEK